MGADSTEQPQYPKGVDPARPRDATAGELTSLIVQLVKDTTPAGAWSGSRASCAVLGTGSALAPSSTAVGTWTPLRAMPVGELSRGPRKAPFHLKTNGRSPGT
jgi:hypothetical protein